MKAPNTAVIGMGYWGKNLVRNIHALEALHTICDSDPGRQSMIQESYPDVRFVTDYAEVLRTAAIDAVVLATPAATHAEMAQAAMAAGKDVYIEKPLALNVTEGEQLVASAQRLGRVLMVGHILQYHPAVVRLRELVRDGALGQIQYLYSNRLNMGKIRIEENILWSFAPHDISVMLSLLGEDPSEISCRGGSFVNPGLVDVTMSQFSFPSGVKAHIFVNWLHPFKEQRLVVVGSEKMAVFDDTIADKLVLYPHRVEWKNRIPTAVKAKGEVVLLDAGEPLRAECQHFLECVAEQKTPLTDGQEGLRVLRILQACQQDLQRAGVEPKGASPRAGSGEHAKPAGYFVHETAVVDEGCQIGDGTKVWHFSHIQSGARIGAGCSFGQNVNVANDVVIGNNVKVQNNVSIYKGVELEDDVFLGPSCVLTNVSNPRSQVNRHTLYEKTLIRRGASIGANATIVCGVTVGRYAFVAAGSVVTKDVPDYALIQGSPARQVDWMSRHGHRLKGTGEGGVLVCPESGYRYRESDPGGLRCLDLDEEKPLPQDKRLGTQLYDEFKQRR
ncbi:MAG: Gfo/Idh/MocA family oxidoreductase [bacterium]